MNRASLSFTVFTSLVLCWSPADAAQIFVISARDDFNSTSRGSRSGSPYNGSNGAQTYDLSTSGDSATGLSGELYVTATGWYETNNTADQFNDEYAGDITGSNTATFTASGYQAGTTVSVYGTWRTQGNYTSTLNYTINGGAPVVFNADSDGGGGDSSFYPTDGLTLDDPNGGTEFFAKIGDFVADGSGELNVVMSVGGDWIDVDAVAFVGGTIIPEPSAATLFGFLGLGLILRRRRSQ